MTIPSAVVIYVLIWWVTLFAVLPWGIRGQAEEGDVVPGSEPGAPVSTKIGKKALYTTIVATIIWAIICALIHFEVVGLDDWPFLQDLPEI